MKKSFSGNLVEALFIREEKNRFLCTIEIENKYHECYVPSSSRLSNYLILDKKKVLVMKTDNPKSRTSFSLFALFQQKRLILLNLNSVNSYVKIWLGKKYPEFSIFSEKNVTKSYKADFYLEKDSIKKVVEVKALFSQDNDLIYPKVRSERLLSQLNEIKKLLEIGIQVEILFVCLNKRVKEIIISNEWIDLKMAFKKCIDAGMEVSIAEMMTQKQDLFAIRALKRNVNIIFENEKSEINAKQSSPI